MDRLLPSSFCLAADLLPACCYIGPIDVRFNFACRIYPGSPARLIGIYYRFHAPVLHPYGSYVHPSPHWIPDILSRLILIVLRGSLVHLPLDLSRFAKHTAPAGVLRAHTHCPLPVHRTRAFAYAYTAGFTAAAQHGCYTTPRICAPFCRYAFWILFCCRLDYTAAGLRHLPLHMPRGLAHYAAPAFAGLPTHCRCTRAVWRVHAFSACLPATPLQLDRFNAWTAFSGYLITCISGLLRISPD